MERTGFLRALVGCISLLTCVYALSVMDRSPGGVPPAGGGSKKKTATSSRTGSSQWQVLVDGWSLRFDGVAPEKSELYILEEDAGEGVDVSVIAAPYLDLIVRYATEAGFDWCFVAALIYEESRFRPESESSKGAYGLMQVREIAAREVGEEAYHDPEANIRVGVRYLKHLEGLFGESEGLDRLALMLAAYNMGPGHVRDAQSLARQLGYNPLRWFDSLERVVPLLEQRPFYQDLPHGYAKGGQTVAYVNRVFDRYSRYRLEKPPGNPD